jgi:two-component system nitrogen regulation response regulator GlnG
MTMHRLLLIDDDRNVRFSIADVFSESDVEVIVADSSASALEQLASQTPDVILLDIRLGNESGLDLFRRIRQADPKALVIFITGHGTAEMAIEAMKLGAFEYIVKPLDTAQLREIVNQAFVINRLTRVPAIIAESDRPNIQPEQLIGNAPAMRAVFKQIGRVAPQNINVLILGESGTGKELVARAINQHSRRRAAPFLAINCAAIPEALLESELFGHEKGAFTGAHQQRIGKFEQCRGGTLLLDEVGDMAPATQAKMLRLLEEGRFERVGGSETIESDVRILAATNQDLSALINQGRFRRDLLYRLSGTTITLPPLRKRREDIPELAHYLLFRFNREVGSSVQSISPEALEILTRCDWPGNVRELQNVMYSALIATIGPAILPAFLPPELASAAMAEVEPPPITRPPALVDWSSLPVLLEQWLSAGEVNIYRRLHERFEQLVIPRVLQHTAGNQARAAELLGLSRITLRSKQRTIHTATADPDSTVSGER